MRKLLQLAAIVSLFIGTAEARDPDLKDRIRESLVQSDAVHESQIVGMCTRNGVAHIYMETPGQRDARMARTVKVAGADVPIVWGVMERPHAPPITLPGKRVGPSAGYDRKTRWESGFPGISAGHPSISAGTSGFFTTNVEVISNSHVFAPSGYALGDGILQPGKLDGGKVGEDEYVTLTKTLIPDWEVEEIEWDLAMGRDIPDARTYNTQLLEHRSPQGVRNPVVGEWVTKSGRTTAVTSSRVQDVDFDVWVQYANKVLRCKNCTRYSNKPVFIQGGDSGSPVLADSDNFAVDVMFASSSQYAFGVGRLVEGLQALGANLWLVPEPEHDWRVAGDDIPLVIPVIDPPSHFEVVGHVLDPPQPYTGWDVTVYTMLKPLIGKYWLKLETYDGADLLRSQVFRVATEQHVLTGLKTPAMAGDWNITQRFYFDANE